MKVLIAFDQSDCSKRAVESVATRTWTEGTQIMLVTAAEPLMPAYGLFVPADIVTSQGRLLAQALGDLTERLKSQTGVKVEGRLLEGYARDKIPAFAREWDADLIIVGSHGRKGFDHAVLGSVAEEIVHKAACSVEVVKGDKSPLKKRQSEETTAAAAG